MYIVSLVDSFVVVVVVVVALDYDLLLCIMLRSFMWPTELSERKSLIRCMQDLGVQEIMLETLGHV
jgi:hypothetical protein